MQQHNQQQSSAPTQAADAGGFVFDDGINFGGIQHQDHRATAMRAAPMDHLASASAGQPVATTAAPAHVFQPP